MYHPIKSIIEQVRRYRLPNPTDDGLYHNGGTPNGGGRSCGTVEYFATSS